LNEVSRAVCLYFAEEWVAESGVRKYSKVLRVVFSVLPTEGVAHERVFPDFIIWLKSDDLQHVIFVDPHGLTHAGNLFRDPKVRLHEAIKHDQKLLAEKSDRDDVRLHSFVVSTTDFDKLPTSYSDDELEDLRDAGVYFPDLQTSYLADLFERVTDTSEPSDAGREESSPEVVEDVT
jgi:hypothetical protein